MSILRSSRDVLGRHGRTIITAEVAVLVQLASVGAEPLIRTALAICGALATALVGIFESERRHTRDAAAAALAREDASRSRRDAIARLSDAARGFRDELANRMPLGGTSVPDAAPIERLALMAEQLRSGRFTFLRGRRWSDWAGLGVTLRRGRQEILAAVGLTGGRLPEEEQRAVRACAERLAKASVQASAIASAYAGYDVTEEPKLPRYMPEDRDVDVTAMPEYASFASDFTVILADLDRLSALTADPR